MGIDWGKSEASRRAIGYLTDPRPAWLWSADGNTLIWSNPAARLFRAKPKRQGLKLFGPLVPIKGQVARLIRLGSIGRASLSRMQFLAGNKPISATCTCTPLRLENDKTALLVVAVDPIDKDIMAAHGMSAEIVSDIFGPDIEFVVLDANGKVLAGSPGRLDYAGEAEGAPTLSAGPGASKVMLFPERETEARAESEKAAGIVPVDAVPEEVPEEPAEKESARRDQPAQRDLTSLLDRLAGDEELFAPLGPQDDVIPEGIEVPSSKFAPAEDAEEAEATGDVLQAEETAALWKIVGRGFEVEQKPAEEKPAKVPEPAEQTSRYNFEELSRILTDRVGGERTGDKNGKQQVLPGTAASTQSSLVNLSDESLVLNRLPLGLLIFSDQHILFANRALTDLVGYPDSASLRSAGLNAIFPTPSETGEQVGPVTHLACRDGSQVPVSARLQSVTWQGRPAFMLTARQERAPVSTEASVRGFVEALAAAEGNGFFEASRAGIIDSVSGRAAELFGRTPDVLIGRPLMLLVGHAAAAPLREFLERPARFAETARPSLVVRGIDPSQEILVFAEGQAGIVTGYFGIVKQIAAAPKAATVSSEDTGVEPEILGRLARSMRRPLNTIIGFSELIRNKAFGPIENPRYVEYARDIKFAGQEIVDVIDELEEFIRLHTGEYEMAPVDFDLGNLLDKCIARVRKRAGEARVLVRSAISERLPHIRADEPSLEQAILNLLASAIDQTPQGGQVVLSAQLEDDGAVSVHVRDSGTPDDDLAERFVVFRDGTDQNGQILKPVQSSVGLALTRSLLAVNTCTLSVDPTAGTGTLLSLIIPADLAVGDK